MDISVIIPCYNAADKIGRCLSSLSNIRFPSSRHEVIFVDDHSTDNTADILQHTCSKHANWRLIRLHDNSGSPSRPRNQGIQEASGEYLFFLDCDDEILPDALSSLLDLAKATNACIVRSELWVDNGQERVRLNQLPDWDKTKTTHERCALLMLKSSTVITSFVKRSHLLLNNIFWPEHLRMGEDTVFLAKSLVSAKVIEYLPQPTFIYNKKPALTPSSTQSYGKRELRDHIEVWSSVSDILKQVNINYIQGRLPVGLRVALESMIFSNRGDIDENTFCLLHEFIAANWPTIGKFSYIKRYAEVLNAIYSNDYNLFCSLCRPRLVIAGHDLKFISDATNVLSKYFDIRIDEWKGHELHDEKQSKELLDWADLIWCEWLLKNAEWYSHYKQSGQRLVIRMHRMELARNHGEKLDITKVDAIVAVSPLFLERLLERYPNIPRHKARYIPNYVKHNEYISHYNRDRLYILGIIGILPSRKGFHRALKILKKLKEKDERFRLEVFGKRPEELNWIARDPKEMEYFKQCDMYIKQNSLASSVNFNGHADIKKALSQRNVGFVLSVSDSDYGFPGPESFHLAVADGFASGAISILRNWPGCEYVWPSKFIASDDCISDTIYKLSLDEELYKIMNNDGMRFVSSRYSVEAFASNIVNLFRSLKT